MKTWLCIICGLVYDEAKGWPEDGIAPGTRWEDVPDDWLCPDCKVGKGDFEMLDVSVPVAAVAAAPMQQTVVAAALPRQPIVIVGSGHAGYGLAAALRKNDPAAEIRVVTADDGFVYSKPALSIGVAQGRDPAAMATESPLAIEQRLGIRVHPHCRVERIDAGARRLHTSLGEMAYGQLVLACGARPVRPAIDGAVDAVLSVNNLQEYRRFRERLAGARRVAILGDGLIGCEFANDLAAAGIEVTVVGLGRWPMERLLPAPAGQRLQAALAGLGVQWRLDTTVRRIDRTADGYRLALADGQHVEADLVLSAIGLRADVSLAAGAGIATGAGIQVDAHLRTSQPGIYALGDCIEIEGQCLPYLVPNNHGIQALARTLLGQPTAVAYPPMPVTVKTPAMPLCLLAPMAGAAGAWQCMPTSDGLQCVFHDTQGALRGFVLLGAAAQAQRNAFLQTCQQDQRAAA
ncbi:FAD-dependent oxidoreductase [Pseudoduganella sp. SL102]|uniref:FAD-dependent oxidoreductase n=1 Tax=Pseudoduganella sp. SL102 TaxID=2995154 RepID=UPI00248C66EF|nr:FAD-dependent oxidoreductase [Pseudoduganella sp. SL102]WBS05190.1 FAD-dependent oxidoreductase [Pseudoduganella sp. SL102]